jgi:hypothetical protein
VSVKFTGYGESGGARSRLARQHRCDRRRRDPAAATAPPPPVEVVQNCGKVGPGAKITLAKSVAAGKAKICAASARKTAST